MRYLVSLIFLLCAACPCYALSPAIQAVLGSSASASAPAYCTSATACGSNHCALLCEDMQGSADCGDETADDSVCRVEWDSTETGEGSSVIFDNSPSAGLGCTNPNTQNAKVTLAGTTGHTAYFKKNLGADYSTTLGVSFYWYTSAVGNTNGQLIKLFGAEDSSNQTVLGLYLYRGAASNYLRITYCKDDACATSVDASTTAFAADTWYRISLLWVPGADNSGTLDVYVNSTHELDIGDLDNYRSIRNVIFGQQLAPSYSYSGQFKNIRIDNTQIPEACD